MWVQCHWHSSRFSSAPSFSRSAGGQGFRHRLEYSQAADLGEQDKILSAYRIEIRYVAHISREGMTHSNDTLQVLSGETRNLIHCPHVMVKFGIAGMTFVTAAQEGASRENGRGYALCRK